MSICICMVVDIFHIARLIASEANSFTRPWYYHHCLCFWQINSTVMGNRLPMQSMDNRRCHGKIVIHYPRWTVSELCEIWLSLRMYLENLYCRLLVWWRDEGVSKEHPKASVTPSMCCQARVWAIHKRTIWLAARRWGCHHFCLVVGHSIDCKIINK